MTLVINDTTPQDQYTATASQTQFSITFEFFETSDIKVYNGDVVLSFNASPSSASQYSVTGAGTNGTKRITLGSPGATVGDVITILRDIPVERTSDFPTSGPFNIGTLNTELDTITAMVAERENEVNRALRAPENDPSSINLVLPSKTSRLGKTLAFDSTTGDPVVGEEIGNYRGDWSASTSYLVRDMVKDTSTSNIFRCKTAHTSTGAQPLTSNADATKWDLIVDAAAAGTSAAAAAASATAAASSATSAATSATTATTQASTSTTKASEASTSATNAATSQTSAATSATTATTKASEASTSATNAAASATSATSSASTATTKASEASTSATNAASSATTATTQASTSTTKAGEAATSATNAASSATAAASSQTAAASSATAAASSATASASSATSASSDATAAAASAASAAGNAGTQSVDRFNGNGSTTVFTMSASPATENNTMVYISGVYQQKDTYSTSGTTLTFSTAPPTGTGNIEVMHMSTTPTGVTPTVAATNTTAAGGNASVTASGHALTFNIPRGDTGATGAASTVAGPQGPAGSDGADGSDGVFSAIASQAEAEAGSDNTKGMSPLRVAQSITANAGAGGATDINGLSDAKRQDTSTYGIGSNALGSLSSGNGANNNLAVGNEAGGGLNGSGTNFPYANTFLGDNAGYGISQTGGTSESVAIGWRALQLHTGAYASTVCGKDAGKNISTGGSNTLYGHTAGDNITTGQNNLCLGRAADASSATVSNEITLGNGNITRFRIPALSLDHTATGLGIGGAPSHKLHVHGDIYSTGNVTAYSSAVAKDNIQTIPGALDIVEQLRGVTFDWKDSGKKAVGLIYEEVKEVIPELTSNNGGHVGVAYQNTVAVLIEAVKSLSAKVKELESKND